MERGTGHGPMSSDPELWSEVVDKDEHAGIALMSRQPIRWQCSCCQHVWRASPHSRSSNGSCCGQQGCERYLGRGADAEKKTGFLTPFLTPKAAAAAPKKRKSAGEGAAAAALARAPPPSAPPSAARSRSCG